MALSSKIKPPIHEAAEELAEALKSRYLTLIIGRCRVAYQGRAASSLDWGDRLIMIKQDGALLVHRPAGYEPVNWQPSGCMLRVNLEDEHNLTVTAMRDQPRERVSITFQEIALLVTGNLTDAADFALHLTEAGMKKAILRAPHLVEGGLKPLLEEKNLPSAGFTDIYAEDQRGNIVVIEIKRALATKDAVLQLKRYIDAVRNRTDRPLRGIIVAPSLQRSAVPLLNRLNLEFVKLSPEKCLSVVKGESEIKLSQFLEQNNYSQKKDSAG